jgi:succinoglycan biosynthesis protein ExoA
MKPALDKQEIKPFVSLVVPCFQEIKYIQSCLNSLVANDYGHDRMEILVTDGMSTDGTREVLREYVEKYPWISVIDNPGALKGRAFNLGVQHARGEVIMIAGAHALYPPQYVSRLVQTLTSTGADNVGGVQVASSRGSSAIARAIGIAISHPFAAGDARHRTGAASLQPVESVFGGCYPKRVFQKIGLFDERLVRTQDREFNTRLRRQGGVILLDPEVRVTYEPRTRLREYARWCYDGGFWLFYGNSFTHAAMISWRNLIPLGFVLYHFLCILLFAISPAWGAIGLTPVLIYWLTALGTSILAARSRRSATLVLSLPVVFAATHYCYGLGCLKGMIRGAWGAKT